MFIDSKAKHLISISRVLFIFLLITSPIELIAKNNSVITWYEVDFPPFFILKGPDKSTGYCNKLQALLMDKLPQYTAQTKQANFKRMLMEIKNEELSCGVCIAKNREREFYIEYAPATDYWIPNGVIISKLRFKEFSSFIDKLGFFMLDDYLASRVGVAGVSTHRVYGQPIDAIVDKYRANGGIIEHYSSNVFESLLSMLEHKRIDLVVGYVHELEYNSKLLKKTEAFSFIPVEGGRAINFVGCSKTAKGRMLIQEITPIIEKNRALISSFYREGLSPKYQELHRKITNEYFKTK